MKCVDYLAQLVELFVQIPDIRTDDDVIDAVVVDEEAVGGEGRGRGAKILYGKGALDQIQVYFGMFIVL